MIRVALFLLVCLLFVSAFTLKEGLEEDTFSLVIQSIESARKDDRMTLDQQIALEDALNYADYIKNITPI
jgi:hypothetical protein